MFCRFAFWVYWRRHWIAIFSITLAGFAWFVIENPAKAIFVVFPVSGAFAAVVWSVCSMVERLAGKIVRERMDAAAEREAPKLEAALYREGGEGSYEKSQGFYKEIPDSVVDERMKKILERKNKPRR